MKYESYSKQVIEEIKKREKLALEAVGQFAVGEAKLRSPEDTGRLMGGNEYRTEPNKVTIGNHVYYAGYVEKGTRFQKAQPFLEPSVIQNQARIEKLISKIIKGG